MKIQAIQRRAIVRAHGFRSTSVVTGVGVIAIVAISACPHPIGRTEDGAADPQPPLVHPKPPSEWTRLELLGEVGHDGIASSVAATVLLVGSSDLCCDLDPLSADGPAAPVAKECDSRTECRFHASALVPLANDRTKCGHTPICHTELHGTPVIATGTQGPAPKDPCSGIVVLNTPDLAIVATAAHCVEQAPSLDLVVVAGVRGLEETIPRQRVARATQLIGYESWGGQNDAGRDVALLRVDPLDRALIAPEILAAPHDGDAAYVLGHPFGLPMALSGGAHVQKLATDLSRFHVDADVGYGSSGSPVFTSDHRLVGVLCDDGTPFKLPSVNTLDRWQKVILAHSPSPNQLMQPDRR